MFHFIFSVLMFTFSLFNYMRITFFVVELYHLVKQYLISLEQDDKKLIILNPLLLFVFFIIDEHHFYVSQFILLDFKFL